MTVSAKPISVPRDEIFRDRAHDGANVDKSLHVAFEAIDVWADWTVHITIGSVEDWTKPDVLLQPTAVISLYSKDDLRWMIWRLQGLLDHITTHDCGEVAEWNAELAKEQAAKEVCLPIGGAK